MKLLTGLLKALLLLLLAALVLLNVLRMVSPEMSTNLLGFSGAVVLSGSMSGTIEVGDLVIIHRQSAYAPGDIITYRDGAAQVTHRIVGEVPGGFQTQGDANNTPDIYPVTMEQIVGRVVLTIPRAGAFLNWLRSPLGLCLLALTGFALLLTGNSPPETPVIANQPSSSTVIARRDAAASRRGNPPVRTHQPKSSTVIASQSADWRGDRRECQWCNPPVNPTIQPERRRDS